MLGKKSSKVARSDFLSDFQPFVSLCASRRSSHSFFFVSFPRNHIRMVTFLFEIQYSTPFFPIYSLEEGKGTVMGLLRVQVNKKIDNQQPSQPHERIEQTQSLPANHNAPLPPFCDLLVAKVRTKATRFSTTLLSEDTILIGPLAA